MATTPADQITDHAHGDDHGHDHDHPSFLAHHFDTPEQQFDSGKLGMWLFLVTEILFFSGMFCAYAIFRSLRPDVFEGCSQFLNTKLGAINTGVLLFSSLTMAWAVRCAQLEEHKKLTALLATTLSCAMVFLGVKAIEYSHKWHLGLLPAGLFTYGQPESPDAPNYLAYICAPFAVATIGVLIWLVISFFRKNEFHVAVAKPLLVVCLSFFGGVYLGTILESGGHDETHASAAHDGGEHADHEHAGGEHADEDHKAETAATDVAGSVNEELSVQERLAKDATNTGLASEIDALDTQSQLADGSVLYHNTKATATIDEVPEDVLTPSKAGLFFSIYYCMTGVHAIHILAGIGVLVWLLVRSVRHDFNRQYFGPVDYVGLYWHLVDLIWIYLFPLLYLIR
ncbi:cytochrome c oxidase subunit 3 [Stieleria varia]|uniref:Cytochrome c oxidase subunit 3 n=1 Tax=Stieleria varia TaxID=2528005 RepID=A0A5C6AY44_9BACT|nr:cytochrome c oxidase subunit 3 [Stieleria varia]TWU04955.1 Cytochrome c oxidase subunit 3 [Stieleria varia]